MVRFFNYIKAFLREALKRYPLLKRTLLGTRRSFRDGSVRRCLHYFQRAHFVRRFVTQKYLANNQFRKLQVGGGYHSIDGWLNGDIIAGDIYLNALKKLPFPDNSIDYIFTEHFFEHISFFSGELFLQEAYRVLKPGGVIRQSTPSLGGVIDIYLDRNRLVTQAEAVQRHMRNHKNSSTKDTACNFVNDNFYLWGHQFIYDRLTLEEMYKRANFIDFQWKKFGESDHLCLQNRERHADVEWMKSAFVIICEARKNH